MKKTLGAMLLASAVLTASNAIADSDKRSSGRNGVQCIDGGERECGIAWEGRGLFEIYTRVGAFSSLSAAVGKAGVFMDLQTAYNCCTEDKTRRAICDEEVTRLKVAHLCYDYLLNFFNPDTEEIFAILEARQGWGKSSRTVWTEKISKMTDDIARSYPDSVAATKMKQCKDKMNENSVQAVRFVWDELTGTNLDESEQCISAMFDTLRDKTTCLWNNTGGTFCDE